MRPAWRVEFEVKGHGADEVEQAAIAKLAELWGSVDAIPRSLAMTISATPLYNQIGGPVTIWRGNVLAVSSMHTAAADFLRRRRDDSVIDPDLSGAPCDARIPYAPTNGELECEKPLGHGGKHTAQGLDGGKVTW